MKKIHITTLGCKVNQFESASFKAGFEDSGYTIAGSDEDADIVVINTCAVTAKAGAQSRQTIRQAIRANPAARIIITGCLAEISADELSCEKELIGKEYTIIGNNKKDLLVKTALQNEISPINNLVDGIAKATEICSLKVRRFSERSRAYLRIQDGCESFCTYCIVPFTRGPSRSLAPAKVIEQAKIFITEGHKEIVLTGIHLGLYGHDLEPKVDFHSILTTLSAATPEIAYRISSLEPVEITDSLLSLIKDRDNIQPHLHIPLQSGDDQILARMNRRYTTAKFRSVIEKCHNLLPDAAIGIDILAGFPGETEQQFNNSLNFLQSLDFSYLHVFPYSIRPGTAAAKFTDQISKKTKDIRVAALRKLSRQKQMAFYKRHIGKDYPVLVEGKRCKNGLLKGFTSNYIAVNFAGPDALLNSVTKIRLLSLAEGHVLAEIKEEHEG